MDYVFESTKSSGFIYMSEQDDIRGNQRSMEKIFQDSFRQIDNASFFSGIYSKGEYIISALTAPVPVSTA